MRIITYNIMKGGEGRADPLAEVIEAQRADLVGLIEADDPLVLERIANRLKMDFIQAPGDIHAVALLSRWPIEWSINHGATLKVPGSCVLEAAIITPQYSRVGVGVLHLPESTTGIDAILSTLEASQEGLLPHVLMGTLAEVGVRAIAAAGYQDLHAATATPTFPTRDPSQRRDFIFTRGIGSASVNDAWIEQDRLARYASDHFPVGVELKHNAQPKA